MAHNLLNEIEIGSKNGLLKKRIITHYMHNGSSTIPDLARELNLSVPTVTKFINEMCDDGYINDYGKLETVEPLRPEPGIGLLHRSGHQEVHPEHRADELQGRHGGSEDEYPL